MARQYLDALTEDVVLRTLVQEYTAVVIEFYAWLATERDQLHSAEFAELERLRRQLREAQARAVLP